MVDRGMDGIGARYAELAGNRGPELDCEDIVGAESRSDQKKSQGESCYECDQEKSRRTSGPGIRQASPALTGPRLPDASSCRFGP